ncbi:heme-degrading monooxygenase HmoA [Oxalobacteraceae bacterium GrIS 1.11]
MIRRATALAVLSISLVLPSLGHAQAKDSAEGVTIVIPINEIGSSHEASVKAMQAIAAVVRKQPGLIAETLLENKNPANKPSHVHVTRWREQKNWTAVFNSAEFQQVFHANSAYIAVSDGAAIFVPMK